MRKVTTYSWMILTMLCSAVTGHAQIDITTGLIAHYPFDGNADDASGNGNHGAVKGAALTTDGLGRENSAYEFNGVDAYITIPNSATLSSPDTELSIVALVNPYGDSKVGSPFGPILVKSNSGTNAFQYRFALDRGASGFYVTLNHWSNNAIATMDIALNKWHALAATVSGNTAKLYHNGRLIDTRPIQGPINYDERPLEIGRDSPGAAEFFWGKIDDIRIFNRELTLEEVREASGILFFDSYEAIE